MSQSTSKNARTFSRRRSILAPALRTFDTLEARQLMTTAGDVLSYHDGSLVGVNAGEVQLTPVNVTAATFGKLYTTPVDGQVYAEPLTMSGVTIAAGVNTSAGAAGVHNVVFVATEHDSLYAIDSTTGAVLWERSFLDASVAANNTLGATAITK